MSRTRRFLGGAGLGYLNQAVVTLVGIWLTRFLLARLGGHDYGLWLVALQILGYLLLADIGVVALLPRETAYETGQGAGAASALRELTGHTVRLVLWQIPFVAVAAAAAWVWLPDSWASLRLPLAPVLVAFVAFFPLRVLPALLQGLQDLAFVGWSQLAGWAITTTVSVGLVVAGQGLSGLAVGWIAGQIATAVMCWMRLKTRYPSVLPHEIPPLSWSKAKEYFSKSVWLSVAQVSQVLLRGSDVLVIGAVLHPAAVVPYTCTSKLISLLTNQPLIFLHSAVPGLSEMRVAESKDRLLQATLALTQGTLILSGAAACIILLSNRWFVSWWVGQDNYGGLALTSALLASMVIRHYASTLVFSLFAFGYERRLAWVGLADGVASIIGTVALVHLAGAVGAPLASFLSACIVSLPPMLAAHSVATGQSQAQAFRALLPLSAKALIAIVPAAAIAVFRPPESMLATAIAVVAVVALYTVAEAPLATRAPLVAYVPPKVGTVLSRLFTIRRADVR